MVGFRLFAALWVGAAMAACAPALPNNTPVQEVRWLDQNWSADERYWFHHATQGTATLPVPYKWFVALEQPRLWLAGEPPMLKDPDYLSRFGFIPSPKTATGVSGYNGSGGGRTYGSVVDYDRRAFPGNPDGLPVGFAVTRAGDTPGVQEDLIGFTCAACHTGHLEYEGVSLRVDGGPAVTNLGKLREVLVLALVYTENVPFRFGRFADRVLGDNHSYEAEQELQKQLGARVDAILAVAKKLEHYEKDGVEEGFARLDALNRIGNQVFTTDFLGAEKETLGFDPWDNYRATDAPVSFPPIWSTSWFIWVQYDASIMQPMVRNAGEALGVSAQINLKDPEKPLFASSLKVQEIHHMERLIAGDNPFVKANGKPETKPHFKGLRAPQWPTEVLGRIDETKRAKGEKLYRKHCTYCHGVPVNDPSGGFWTDADKWTRANKARERYYKVTVKEQHDVGTDPAQGNVLATRTVKVPAYLKISRNAALCGQPPEPPSTEAGFGSALAAVVAKTAAHWYDQQDPPFSRRQRQKWNGNRPNCIQAGAGYKARPLNGIWATAPYLHNGAVPNLYAMLLPADERPTKFCLGHREFDPKHVGYRFEEPPCPQGTFELDTAIAGNSNAGHEFKDAPDFGGGVVGKKRLTDDERWALVEYLKTL